MNLMAQLEPAVAPDELDEQNCPRGKFSVELLNAMNSPFCAWREVTAARSNVDFFERPIKSGERHYFRAIGPGVDSCERLTALSMDRLLWVTFGTNQALIDLCQQMAAQQKAQLAHDMARAIHRTSSESP